MGRRVLLPVFACWLAAVMPGCFLPVAVRGAPVPLIPRSVLFGSSNRSDPQISPDGRSIAFLGPRNGVLNVWVEPVGHPEQARPVTAETSRPLMGFTWSPDSRRVIYSQDTNGNENFQVFGADVRTGEIRTYTRFPGSRADIIGISPDVPDAILLGINNRDPAWADVWRLQLSTGAMQLIYRNDRYGSFVADQQLKLVLASRTNADGSATYDRIDTGGAPRPVFTVPFADTETTRVLQIPDGDKDVVLVDSRDRDKAALVELDLASGERRVLATDPDADVDQALMVPTSGTPEAYSAEYLERRWQALDQPVARDFAFLDAHLRGSWSVISQSRDDRLWTLLVDRVVEAPVAMLYDRNARKLTELFPTHPGLARYRLAAMKPVRITARDGLVLPAYLSMPVGTPSGRPVPLVLLVHGGPDARDDYGYDPYPQWLANRGYAVLQPQYRGSTGFGKSFLAAGDRQWGGTMEDDLLDAAAWAVAHHVTTPDRMAIEGGSYGGYATLAALTMHPDAFRCGVDIVGPADLVTMLAAIPPYWKTEFEQLAQRVGDPRTVAGRQLLRERSPLNHIDGIRRPLLIGQGMHDVRVSHAEPDRVVAAMTARSIPVTYVTFPDEGHGFGRTENAIAFNAVNEIFLASCLGGRSEPIGHDFGGSSITVPRGAALLPGLQAALQPVRPRNR